MKYIEKLPNLDKLLDDATRHVIVSPEDNGVEVLDARRSKHVFSIIADAIHTIGDKVEEVRGEVNYQRDRRHTVEDKVNEIARHLGLEELPCPKTTN